MNMHIVMKWKMSKKVLAECNFQTNKENKRKEIKLITTSLLSHPFITRNLSSKKKRIKKSLIAASVLSDPHTPETQL